MIVGFIIEMLSGIGLALYSGEKRRYLGGPNAVEKRDFIVRQIDSQLHYFETRRFRNKVMATVLNLSAAVAAAVGTILLGWNGLEAESTTAIKNYALIVMAFVTVVNAWNSFIDNRGTWVRYAIAVSRLKNLKMQVDYRSVSESFADADADKLFVELKEILDDVNSQWLALRSASASPKKVAAKVAS